MLRIWNGTSWLPSEIPYVGKYQTSLDVTVGNVDAPIKPSAPTSLAINTATSKQLGVSWSAPTTSGLPSTNDKYDATSYAASGAIASGYNYYVKNTTTGEVYDANTLTSWTDTALASSTTYAYIVYSGNAAFNAGTSTNGASKSATTKTDAVRTTRTWGCVWSESYQGDGDKVNTSYLYHGDFGGSANGNQRAHFGFNIGQGTVIPSNATIHSVKIYLYASHWYNNAGGDCNLYLMNSQATSEPAAPTGSAVSSATLSWSTKTGGKWITLPVDFGNELRGTGGQGNRVFYINASTGTNGYGYFNGAGMSSEPQLQIDYTYYT
jgi:hypothetical protein